MDRYKPQAKESLEGRPRQRPEAGSWSVYPEGQAVVRALASDFKFHPGEDTCLLVFRELNATWAMLKPFLHGPYYAK